jgi:outer membrane protein OmpA-like peptidoglycan-associated protein
VVQDSYPQKSTEVPRDYYPLLTRVARVLARFPERRIRVEGHADTQEGTKEGAKEGAHASSPWQLGYERAWAITEFLISRGLDPSRVEVTTHGATTPIKSEAQAKDPRWARARNRRVELRVGAVVKK